jgi:hypothetical protein
MNVKFTRPRSFISGNLCFEFAVQCKDQMKVFIMTASTGRIDQAGLSFFYLSLVLAPWCTEGERS